MEIAPIRFLHGSRWVTAEPASGTRTVLEWLREDARCTGTKEGCAEGDCGACTVVVGTLAAEVGMRYRAVNACIQFLPTLHGKQLVTVEQLQGENGALHPVQRAMVEHHAAQCGFCTPGFVMSLYALYVEKKQAGAQSVSRDEAVRALAGNLCRCTGYRPILDAAQAMLDESRYGRSPALTDLHASAAALRTVDDVALPDFLAPRSERAFAQLRMSHPEALILAGGTDVGLWVTKQHRALGTLLHTGRVEGFERIEHGSDSVAFGPAVTLADAWEALLPHYPRLQDYLQRFASPPIRNAGTLVGNVANGSPIGDSMPVLIALGAELVLQRGETQRTLPLESFYLGYRKTALTEGEFVRWVRVPLLAPERFAVAAYKLSKRFEQDISAIALAIALELQAGVVRDVRIGVGGMSATPARAVRTEAVLTGVNWNEAGVEAAAQTLETEFQPIDDMRASAAYRRIAIGNMLRRFFLEHAGRARPLRELSA